MVQDITTKVFCGGDGHDYAIALKFYHTHTPLFQTFNLSESDLHELCLSGVDAAFLPQKEKEKLRHEVQEELDSLKEKLALR